jgi:DNA-binding PadR family transcriptional regulator
MRRNENKRRLTELEGAALAQVVRAGSCTPYAIKETFRTSPSRFWSGSAGAVYPLVRRLVARGLLVSRRDLRDRRARRVVSATPAGRAALLSWLVDAERAADFGFDPLRTRLFYSELVPPRRLQAFLAETAGLLAIGTPAPRTDLAHVLPLHASWARLRRSALAEFAKRVERKPRRRGRR